MLPPAITTRSSSSKPIGPFQVANQASISRRASRRAAFVLQGRREVEGEEALAAMREQQINVLVMMRPGVIRDD